MDESALPSYRRHYGRQYIDSMSLRVIPSDKPDADAIGSLRYFLTCCLAYDYGVIGYNDRQFDILKREDWKIMYVYFRILGGCRLSYGKDYKSHWKKYFAFNFDETSLAIGIPLPIARHMLACFHFGLELENADRFLAYRTYARSIPDVAEKLYFDREIVIDAAVEDHELRALLKERLAFVERMWFTRLDSPHEGDYTLSSFGVEHKAIWCKPWKPTKFCLTGRHLHHWRFNPHSPKKLFALRKDDLHDDELRKDIFRARKPPGTPRYFWPQKQAGSEGESQPNKENERPDGQEAESDEQKPHHEPEGSRTGTEEDLENSIISIINSLNFPSSETEAT